MPPEKDHGGAVPLLGLELTTTEIIEELGSKPEADSFESSLNPLLGTNILKTNTKSSQARSSDRVCYGSLLRFGAQSSDISLRDSDRNSPRGCYGSIKNRSHPPHPPYPHPRLLHHRHHHTGSCGLRLRAPLTQSLPRQNHQKQRVAVWRRKY